MFDLQYKRYCIGGFIVSGFLFFFFVVFEPLNRRTCRKVDGFVSTHQREVDQSRDPSIFKYRSYRFLGRSGASCREVDGLPAYNVEEDGRDEFIASCK